MTTVNGLPELLPLVGRTAELARLEALMESGGEGPRVLFLRGEGGVGKSRLAAELAERAARRSWSVAHGRAFPVETGTPYAVFSDAWLPVLRDMEPSTITVLSRGGDAELRHLFPGLAGDGAVADPTGSEPDEFRTRLMWSFAEFIKRYSARSPILCVLEDLQWADESSLELIHFLARQTQGQPAVFVCTYNDQERDPGSALAQTERSLTSIALGDTLHLDPLTRDHVTELVSRTFGVNGVTVRDFSAVLFGWTRGNAFFLEEILKSLVGSGRLRRESGAWVGWDAKEFGMPGSIRDAVVGRVHGFPGNARKVAEMAAIAGRRVSYPLLEAISGLEAADALDAVEALCAHGILDERSANGDVVYDFRHPLVRQTLYDEFGLQRARVLHGEVAEAMERIYEEDAEEHADELAFHYTRTSGQKLKEKATKYLVAAGRRALERRADLEAISYLQGAMERLDSRDPALAEVVPLLARAHTHVGQFDESAALWEAALRAVDPTHPTYANVCRAIGITNVWRDRPEDAEEWFGRGLESAERTGDERAAVRLLVAQAHGRQELGQGDEALELLKRALPRAEAFDDAGLLARVHRALALLHVWVGPPEQAIEHAEEAIRLAREVGNLSVEFWARWGLAVLHGMRGDTRLLATAIDEVNEIADQARSPVLRLWTADMAVELAYATGRWDEGIAAGEQAIGLARALNQVTLLPRLLVWTSQFHVARADLDRAQALIDEAVEVSGLDDDTRPLDMLRVHQVVPTYIGLAHYKVALGDYEEAIDAAEKGLQIAEGTGFVLWAMHVLLPILGEACLWAGHFDRAEQVGRLMRQHSERIDHRLGLAWADACDSLVQWKRGDPAGAVGRMRRAADELDAIPMIWNATRLRRQLAGRLADIGRPMDEVKAELDKVHDVCVRLGAGLELEKTRRMYRENGLRPPPIASSGGELGLTPSELKVAILVAYGLTNNEVAEVLGIAVRTASTHLSNIYQKLEIGRAGARMRLGNLARDEGLLDSEQGVRLKKKARGAGLLT